STGNPCRSGRSPWTPPAICRRLPARRTTSRTGGARDKSPNTSRGSGWGEFAHRLFQRDPSERCALHAHRNLAHALERREVVEVVGGGVEVHHSLERGERPPDIADRRGP